jgi:hypothetical protein
MALAVLRRARSFPPALTHRDHDHGMTWLLWSKGAAGLLQRRFDGQANARAAQACAMGVHRRRLRRDVLHQYSTGEHTLLMQPFHSVLIAVQRGSTKERGKWQRFSVVRST